MMDLKRRINRENFSGLDANDSIISHNNSKHNTGDLKGITGSVIDSKAS